MEHEKQFIEEWNSSVEIKKLKNKRTRQVDKNSNFKLREIQQPEIIINNISELSKEERKKLLQDSEKKNFVLENLPSAELYEKSYMHRDVVDGIVSALETDFVMTTSLDGNLKFWKKNYVGIEFVKHYKAHKGKITGISISHNGAYMATCSFKDESLKIFDVNNFDMIVYIQLKFVPLYCEFVSKINDPELIIAVTDKDTNDIHLIKAEGKGEIYKTVKIHSAQISTLKYNEAYDCVLSIDTSGIIEYWDPIKFEMPKSVKFEFKVETDLFELVKCKTICLSLSLSLNGQYFVTFCKDKHLRLFEFSTGKLLRTINESLKFYIDNYNQILQNELTRIDKHDLDKRLSVEREIEKYLELVPQINAQFDETNSYLLYSSLIGIKVIELNSGNIVKIIGKKESTERFLTISLFQGRALRNNSGLIGTGGASSQGDKVLDPSLFCISYKRNRVYIFSKREPAEADNDKGLTKRDILNEKPTKDDIQNMIQLTPTHLATQAIIETSLGEIHIKLFAKEVPKTVENFVSHSRNGYFNNLIFHRVIKGFMVQTGDPKGDGTGGESVWGSEFEDEFNPALRHEKPFTVSMANCGPNTNGSQFFITTVPCPWLDNKHTVFGRVFKGLDTVQAIENVKCDRNDKPMIDVRLFSIKIIS